MEDSFEEVPLGCPMCDREFELPRRFLAREDDVDFAPVPRILSCLHTVCHSCLEEVRERSTLGKVVCPVCKYDEAIKGVKYLPLNVSVLTQLMKANKAQLLSYCSRCYDDVPSYSWCITCSSALCEFHHQDHKLSFETSRHTELYTFKEIEHKKLHIEPRLPPPYCPEVLMQECSAYCRTCKHLASVHACLQFHGEHSTVDCKVAYPEMKDRLEGALRKAEKESERLLLSKNKVRDTLRLLDDDVSKTVVEIETEFEALRQELRTREEAMMQRLTTVANRKRDVLTSQLNDLSDVVADCKQAADVATELLRDTSNADERTKTTFLVGAAALVEERVAKISEVGAGITAEPLADPEVAVAFSIAEIETIRSIISSLGSIHTADGVEGSDVAAAKAAKPPSTGEGAPDKQDGDAEASSLSLSRSSSSKHLAPNESSLSSAPQPKLSGAPLRLTNKPGIAFSVRAEPSTQQPVQASSKPDGGNQPHATRTKRQSLIIEVRAAAIDDDPSHSAASKATMAQGAGYKVASASVPLGRLLGQVVLVTELDRRLAHRHEVRTFLESSAVSSAPIIKVSKEFVPTSAL